MAERIERAYLLVISISKPKPEHKAILEQIRKYSGGNFKAVHFDKNGGYFLLKSRLYPNEMGFGNVLLNDDRLLVIEIGENWAHQGWGLADGWLNANVKARR